LIFDFTGEHVVDLFYHIPTDQNIHFTGAGGEINPSGHPS
jgi:hypothetical protein